MSALLRFHAGGVGLALPISLVAAVHAGRAVRRVPGLPSAALGFVGQADTPLAILDPASLVGATDEGGDRAPRALVALTAPLAGVAIALQAPPWISPPGSPAGLPARTAAFCRAADREAGGDVHAIIDPELLGGLLAAARPSPLT